MDAGIAIGLSIGGLVLLLALGVPIAFALGLTAVVGIFLIDGVDSMLAIVSFRPYASIAVYMWTVLPLFIAMGHFAQMGGISTRAYSTAHKLLGGLPGGLGIASIMACAGFAAASGSSVATAATVGRVAIPEMRKRGYSPMFATGCVAASGGLGILIPPSNLMVIYGMVTGESIGKLLIAGFIPGVLSAIILALGVVVLVKFKPHLAPIVPKEARAAWKERLIALREIWGLAILVLIIIGGIYFGVFTPTEAGAAAAGTALLLALPTIIKNPRFFLDGLLQTSRTCSMIFAIIIGAMLFTTFLALSGVLPKFTAFIVDLPLPRMVVLSCILLLYIPLGMFIESTAMVLMTLPIIYPAVIALGFDGIWFAIPITVLVEISLITPPVGMNVFVIKGLVPDIPISDVFRGAGFFFLLQMITLIILIAFPQISLFLPRLMA